MQVDSQALTWIFPWTNTRNNENKMVGNLEMKVWTLAIDCLTTTFAILSELKGKEFSVNFEPLVVLFSRTWVRAAVFLFNFWVSELSSWFDCNFLLTCWQFTGRQHSLEWDEVVLLKYAKKEMREPRWLVPFSSLCHDISWLNTRHQNGIVVGKRSVWQI